MLGHAKRRREPVPAKQCLSGPSGFPLKYLVTHFLRASRCRASVQVKQRRRQNDSDFALPSLEQLLWPLTQSPRGLAPASEFPEASPLLLPTAATVSARIFPHKS